MIVIQFSYELNCGSGEQANSIDIERSFSDYQGKVFIVSLQSEGFYYLNRR